MQECVLSLLHLWHSGTLTMNPRVYPPPTRFLSGMSRSCVPSPATTNQPLQGQKDHVAALFTNMNLCLSPLDALSINANLLRLSTWSNPNATLMLVSPCQLT